MNLSIDVASGLDTASLKCNARLLMKKLSEKLVWRHLSTRNSQLALAGSGSP
jgi:hypothetical protein